MAQAWTQKVTRFRIQDPWLRILTTRHEAEIPWLVSVRDETTLLDHVRTRMLPRLERQTHTQRLAKVYGVDHTHVNVRAALAEPQGLKKPDRD